jgi:hypothetical protein
VVPLSILPVCACTSFQVLASYVTDSPVVATSTANPSISVDNMPFVSKKPRTRRTTQSNPDVVVINRHSTNPVFLNWRTRERILALTAPSHPPFPPPDFDHSLDPFEVYDNNGLGHPEATLLLLPPLAPHSVSFCCPPNATHQVCIVQVEASTRTLARYSLVLFYPVVFADGTIYMSSCSYCSPQGGDVYSCYHFSFELPTNTPPPIFSCVHTELVLTHILHNLGLNCASICPSTIQQSLRASLTLESPSFGSFELVFPFSSTRFFARVTEDIESLLFLENRGQWSCIICRPPQKSCSHLLLADPLPPLTHQLPHAIEPMEVDDGTGPEDDLRVNYILSEVCRDCMSFLAFFLPLGSTLTSLLLSL